MRVNLHRQSALRPLPSPQVRRHRAVTAFLAFCLFSLLTGCQMQPPQPWHLTARKQKDAVQLCLSPTPACPQPDGISLSSISVYRYDSTHDNQLVWDAEAESPFAEEKVDGRFTYGVPPQHWHNKMTPPAPVCGKAYLVNPGAVFFGLKCDGTVVVFDFPQLDDFFRQSALPEPTKKTGP